MKYDINEVKRGAGLAPYKKRLSLKKAGKDYLAPCPWHGDEHPSFSIYEKNGVYLFKCFPCGANGDVIGFVQRKDGVTFREALEVVAREAGLETHSLNQPFEFDRIKATGRLEEAENFLKARGIPIDVARKRGLGVVDFPGIGPSIAIPYNETVVKFRALNPRNKGEKFRHLPGHPSSDLIYGIGRLDDVDFVFDPAVYVVESELDALTMEAHGFIALSVSSATSCLNSDGGLKFSKELMERISNAEKIVLAMDMDGAGQRCAEAFSKALPPYKTQRLIWQYSGKESGAPKDLGEIYQQSPDGFRERIRQLSGEALDRLKRNVYVYSDLPRAYDLSLDIQKVDWLVQDILPLNDKALLSGYWGNYKSFIALSLAKAVATGGKCFGQYETKQRPVLYLDKENSRSEIGRRSRALQIPKDADLRIWCEKSMPFPKIGDPRLLAFAEELKPLFIVDTLTGFSEAEDENAAREMRRELEKYMELISRGATVLVLHHPPKNRAEVSETNWFRGSGDIAAFFAMGFYVHVTNEEQGIIEFSTAKSRVGPRPHFALQAWPYLDPMSEGWRGDFAVLEKEQLLETENGKPLKMAEVIVANPGINQREIAMKSGLSLWQVRNMADVYESKLWRSEKRGRDRRFFPPPAINEKLPF